MSFKNVVYIYFNFAGIKIKYELKSHDIIHLGKLASNGSIFPDKNTHDGFEEFNLYFKKIGNARKDITSIAPTSVTYKTTKTIVLGVFLAISDYDLHFKNSALSCSRCIHLT